MLVTRLLIIFELPTLFTYKGPQFLAFPGVQPKRDLLADSPVDLDRQVERVPVREA